MPRNNVTEPGRDLPPLQSAPHVLRVVYSAARETIGRIFPLDGATFVIGRECGGDGEIQDPRLSREHAVITPGNESYSYFVRDAGSSNGTHLNGRRVGPGQAAPLQPGHVLAVGATLLVVDEEPDPDSLPVASGARGDEVHEIVGASLFTERLRRSIATVARADGNVLLLGNPGTGKEVIAQAIHRLSGRSGVIKELSCATLQSTLAEAELFGTEKNAYTGAVERSGAFNQADGGTLFLDEVGELPWEVQSKLLRAIETQKIQRLGSDTSHKLNVRVIAATNARIDLEGAQFRRDLFERLTTWIIRSAPLYTRRADILPLFEHFFRLRGRDSISYTCELAEALLLHAWPGNVRGLRHQVDRLIGLIGAAEAADIMHLSEELQRPIRERKPLHEVPAEQREAVRWKCPPKETIESTLAATEGNITAAAKSLGIHKNQLDRCLGYYGIDRASFRPKR